MLAIHWSPVKNTKHILKNGIKRSKNGLRCFPLTGHPRLDKEGAKFLGNPREGEKRTPCDGFIFRITQADLPAIFADFTTLHLYNLNLPGVDKDELFKSLIFYDIKKIRRGFRESMLSSLGSLYAGTARCPPLRGRYPVDADIAEQAEDFCDEDYIKIANSKINSGLVTFAQLYNDFDFMGHVFEDYLIILFNSIKPNRIIKVISDRNDDKKASHKYKKNRDRQIDEISEYFANV